MPAARHIRPVFRIIGGRWRGRKVGFAASPSLRASGDRLRESLFNCLGQRLDGRTCLDLFAGAGALGLEAASRGARQVVFVEPHAPTAHALQQVSAALAAAQMQVCMGTALDFLAATDTQFDVIFLDPPFADYAADKKWTRLLAAAAGRLADGGVVYCESDRHFPLDGGVWRTEQCKKTGAVCWQLLRKS